MYYRAQKDQQTTNVIHFRPKQAAFVLPKDPTGEELAFDWTLSETDKSRVLECRGDDNRRRYAVQLCVLRKYGRFLDNYHRVPAKVIGYLSHQLEIEPILSLPAATREATEAGYRDDIRRYLSYHQFDEAKKQNLESGVLSTVSESFYIENLIENAENHLKDLTTIELHSDYLSGFHPVLANKLGTAVKSYDAWRIRRFEDNKRYALCACYLFVTLQGVVDNLVDMNARFLPDMEREAKNIYEHAHRRLRKRLRKGIPTLEAFATSALALDNSQPVDLLYRVNDRTQVKAAVEDSMAFRQLEERGYVEILHGKYPNFKRYFPLFLELDFQAVKGALYLLEAIDIAREFNTGKIKHLPTKSPCRFIPRRWHKMLHTEDGRLNPRTWELGLCMAMKDALKSGDLFLPAGRHYVSFLNLVYDDNKWAAEKNRVCIEQGFTLDSGLILQRLNSEFDQVAKAAVAEISRNSFINPKNGKIRFSRDKAASEQPEVKKLRQLIEADIPKIRIEQLLMEVDALCSFSRELRPLEYLSSRRTERLPTLLAAIVGHGTNLGVFTMADSTAKMTVDMLRNISKACLRQETLKAANTELVNYQKSLEASSIWGEGLISSSDGQRFGVSQSSLITSFYPRYFGYYDRVITVYTHISDLLSVFNTLVISCGQKEALYVLNGLLENDSELTPHQHHTDTGGYTDHLFALCFLLGISFMPRIKSLHKRRLFKIDKKRHYGQLESLFKGTIKLELIREQWELLVRVAASLKNRIVPADVIVKRLVSSSPADRLSKALTELGRLVKTVYILSYIQDETIRRQVQLQLNRGEQRQGLAKHVFFADQGEFRSADLAQIMNKASCLSLLSNAILVWNIIHIAQIVKSLRSRGHNISDAHLAKVSPLIHKHVIVNGTYDFSPSGGIQMATQ